MARDADAAEHARKDPHLGTGGVVAILLLVAADIVALVSLAPLGGIRGGLVLVAVASASRVVPILVTIGLRGLRPAPTTTLGSWFADRVTLTDAVVALASVVIVTVALVPIGGLIVPIAVLATLIAGCAAGAIVVALRGGLDGDGMGALIELSVMAGLIAAAIVS